MHPASQRPIASERTVAEPLDRAERDFVALGIAVAALILFIGLGGRVMSQVLRNWMGIDQPPDILLTNALLLNIALLIFGWRRYAELRLEVEARREAEEHARRLAESDPLTGCRNRRSVTPAIEEMLHVAARRKGEVALLLIDVDNFKTLNDRFGHKIGDAVLVETAERIHRMLPPDAILARMGGDEFACALIVEADGQAHADRVARDILGAISAPVSCEDDLIVDVTVSMGLTTSGQLGTNGAPPSADTLIHRADIAMYHAKKHGRDGSAWFEPQMESDARFRSALQTALRHGIERGEFIPYYEQQIDIQTGKLVGFEMLARWKSPEFGIVGPDMFIPMAEEMGVIAELSERLIAQALQDARSWDDGLTLSVNISPLQLRDPWFAHKLLRLLTESGFPPQRFEIEITESCLHENMGVVRAILTSLKNQGVCISLDDFGTGYSSLAQLRALPFDRLKIDRSFVTELAQAGTNAELVSAIVALGRGLGLPIVAEGIETDEALEALRALGEIKGQGYLYGRPEDAEATLRRLMEQAAREFPSETRKVG
ncbi:EAL domain-containing protein [Altererythrobacter soli]|uniref:EAL domain-containing protein n=1 Tax=Croceibacterium soli TaxID=1739690 RepID=A0A6I4UUS3_9SPHN|nr:EAL domain-containing protein [Croceibacterium soli]MXP41263.1 EAL domain-containing protein [Croceibacterium soli]